MSDVVLLVAILVLGFVLTLIILFGGEFTLRAFGIGLGLKKEKPVEWRKKQRKDPEAGSKK